MELPNEYGLTLPYLAVAGDISPADRVAMARRLLEDGADPNRCARGCVSCVGRWGAVECVAYFRTCVYIYTSHARSGWDGTPLYWAVRQGQYDLAALLLEHGADPARPVLPQVR